MKRKGIEGAKGIARLWHCLGAVLFKFSAKMGAFTRCDCPFGSGLEQIGIGKYCSQNSQVTDPARTFTPPDARN